MYFRFRFDSPHKRKNFTGNLCGVQFDKGVSEVINTETEHKRYTNQGRLLMRYHRAVREEVIVEDGKVKVVRSEGGNKRSADEPQPIETPEAQALKAEAEAKARR